MHTPIEFQKFNDSNTIVEMSLKHDRALNIVFESNQGIVLLNNDLEIEKHAPGFYAFATDGGNEVYAFGQGGAVFMLPMIGLSEKDAIKVANSWIEFEKIIKLSAQQSDASETMT